MFFRANLQAVLELLQDSEGLLSEEAVRALGFILSVSKSSHKCTLLDLAVSASSHAGYSKVD